LNIIYSIDSQPALVHTFKVFEVKALNKNLFLHVIATKFFVYKKGQQCGDVPLFETDDFGAMRQFIDNAVA